MTKVVLLNALKEASIEATKDLILPVAQQKDDKELPQPQPVAVYCMRLPDGKAAKKKAPYIIHQFITGKDIKNTSTAMIRTIFCVYHPDEQEGGLALLNLMERLRIALLEQGIIGKQFRLDTDAGLEQLVYPEDTAPYYAGEMISVWKLPAIERKVPYGKEGHSGIHPRGVGAGCQEPCDGRFYGHPRP